MSPGWDGKSLLEPISADAPCGKNVEDTDVLAAFDAYQLFGQTSLEHNTGIFGAHWPSSRAASRSCAGLR